VNCFTDEEERKVKKDKIVPFLLESKLRELGALIEKEQPFEAFIVEDSHLITGQNPKSAPLVANAMLRVLGISPYQETRKEVA
jgi:putative intracellular protease/amidase